MLPRGMKREELMEELKTVEGVEIYTEED
jgi:putative Mg2+ transporter-C (MgtC) family protein